MYVCARYWSRYCATRKHTAHTRACAYAIGRRLSFAEFCSEEVEGLFDFISAHYCKFESLWSTTPLYAVVLSLLFYSLEMVTEDHFCSSLAYLSNRFNLSPDFAGATLLAFANGGRTLTIAYVGELRVWF